MILIFNKIHSKNRTSSVCRRCSDNMCGNHCPYVVEPFNKHAEQCNAPRAVINKKLQTECELHTGLWCECCDNRLIVYNYTCPRAHCTYPSCFNLATASQRMRSPNTNICSLHQKLICGACARRDARGRVLMSEAECARSIQSIMCKKCDTLICRSCNFKALADLKICCKCIVTILHINNNASCYSRCAQLCFKPEITNKMYNIIYNQYVDVLMAVRPLNNDVCFRIIQYIIS